jgi:hypothetical protein
MCVVRGLSWKSVCLVGAGATAHGTRSGGEKAAMDCFNHDRADGSCGVLDFGGQRILDHLEPGLIANV